MKGQYQLTAKNTIFYSLGNMAGKLSGVILLPLYAKFLSIEELGLVGLFESIYMLFLILSGMGIKGALMRWYWDKEKVRKQKSILFSALSFNSATALIFTVLSYFAFIFFSDFIFQTTVTYNVVILLIVSNFLKMMVDFPQLLQRMQQKAMAQTIYQIIILIINVSVTAYLLIYKDFKLEAVLWGQILANGIVLIIQIPYLISNSEFKFEKIEIKEMFHFGYPLFLSSLLTYFLVLTDKFIINYYNGLADSGLFTLALKISTVVQLVFVTSFNQAYVHVFYKNMDEEGMKKFFTKTLNYFTLGISFLSMILILFSKEIIILFSVGNTDYWGAYIIVPFLVTSLIFTGINGQLILPFQKMKMTKLISKITIISAAINFVLNLILIPHLSSIGAAISTGLAQLFSMICYFYFMKKRDVAEFELAKILKIFGLIAATLFVYYIINDYSLLYRVVLKILLLSIFAVFIYFFNILDNNEIKNFTNFIKEKIKQKK